MNFSTRSQQSMRRSSTIPKVVITSHHLFLHMRDISYHMGEDAELYFSLYNNSTSCFISERFCVTIAKEGFSNFLEKPSVNCTLFTELGVQDINSDLCLVCQIVRVGRMLVSESGKKSSSQLYRSLYLIYLILYLNIFN